VADSFQLLLALGGLNELINVLECFLESLLVMARFVGCKLGKFRDEEGADKVAHLEACMRGELPP
jgi:hypothetical protein